MPRCRWAIVACALAFAAAPALAGCGSTSSALPAPPEALPCAPQPSGALCIKVLLLHHAVGDVVAYLAASDSPLAHRTWRLVLSRYRCDPGSGSRPACRPAASYPGPTRHGRPPLVTSCRVNGGATVVTAPIGCHDTLAQELATLGEWAGFYRLADGRPKAFTSQVWLCVSEQLLVGGAWRQPDPTMAPLPRRACAGVAPA